MRPTFYEPIRSGGFLAIMPRPAGAWLAEEICALRDAGVGVVVSLLTDEEAHELGLQGEAEACQSCGIEFISHPIPDRSVPQSVSAVALLAEDLQSHMSEGTGVLIHCRAGIGRSSLVAAAVLLREGYAPADAFALISRARRVECPDTAQQSDWLAANAPFLVTGNSSCAGD
jgi:protein-tyrosine phosphatase